MTAGSKPAEKTGLVTVLSEDQFRTEVEDYTDAEWKYLGESVAVVDFYADWCGPCRKLAPLMEELAKEYEGKVRLYKVNVDNAKQLSKSYGIRSIPTVFFIPVSGQPEKNVGLMTKEEFKTMIESLLDKE